MASTPAAVMRLWEVCQIPDYRKISNQNHAELVSTIYKFLQGPEGRVPEDWFAKQVAFADRTDGDIDTLANRIAHIRTWTFVANRADWLKDPEHWQARTRADRGQPVGRAARMPDPALCRSPHERADEGHARQGRAERRDRRRRRHSRREPLRRPAQGLPVLARCPGRRHPRQGDAPCRRAGAVARTRHARAPRRGGQGRCLQADAGRPRACGTTRRSPASKPATTR